MQAITVAAIVAAGMTTAASSARASVDFTTMQLNGGATATANDLVLGDGGYDEARSAFFTSPIASDQSFSGSFDFTLTGAYWGYPQADGVSFLIQNDPGGASAVGGNGGNIGAAGVQNAVGIGFQSWVNNHATIFTTASGPYSGAQPLGNFDLGDQDDNVSVSFSYAAATGMLSYTAFNSSTGQSVSGSYQADLNGLGSKVFVGFTGGSGGSDAFEHVTNFNLTVGSVPEPSTWAMMALGFAGLAFAGLRARRSDVKLPVTTRS